MKTEMVNTVDTVAMVEDRHGGHGGLWLKTDMVDSG